MKVIGNSLPDYEYSFNLGLNYKGFDLSAFFQGVGKHDFWAFGSVAIPSGGSGYMDSAFKHQMDYWTENNTDAFYPRPANTAWVSNGRELPAPDPLSLQYGLPALQKPDHRLYRSGRLDASHLFYQRT